MKIVLAILFLSPISLFAQRNNSQMKELDSLLNIGFKALWIEYQIQEKLFNNKDTVIEYSETELEYFYYSEIIELDQDTFFILKPVYALKFAEYIEKISLKNRSTKHTGGAMFKIIDKNTIYEWENWVAENKQSIDIKEIRNIFNIQKKPSSISKF